MQRQPASCGVSAGPADISLSDCVSGDVTEATCDSFVEEECEYLGEDTGFGPPAGEITEAEECKEFCRDIQVIDQYILFDPYRSLSAGFGLQLLDIRCNCPNLPDAEIFRAKLLGYKRTQGS